MEGPTGSELKLAQNGDWKGCQMVFLLPFHNIVTNIKGDEMKSLPTAKDESDLCRIGTPYVCNKSVDTGMLSVDHLH